MKRPFPRSCPAALGLSAILLLSAGTHPVLAAGFTAGRLAVLRLGDGGTNGGASDFASRQTPIFIDEYDTTTPNQDHPASTVMIPTNGPGAIFINGNASTEGGMARSADHKMLTFSGYCGNILSLPGTPSKVAYPRGICVVQADGATRLAYSGPGWYGLAGGKTNPRGAVSDGQGDYWGCGSEIGTLFDHPNDPVVTIKSIPRRTRAIKFVNNSLHFSIMGSDVESGQGTTGTAGIYSFVDASGAPVAMPKTADARTALVLAENPNFDHVTGFDISPKGDVAYTADIFNGIQKYMKSGNDWKLACNFYIPGYDGPHTGILTNAASTSVKAGCFGLCVDFSGDHPVIFATTTEAVGYRAANVNSNRLIRLDDTNNETTGLTITNFARTLATAGATNISFRALDFTPDLHH